jgi:hypothetical protein
MFPRIVSMFPEYYYIDRMLCGEAVVMEGAGYPHLP